jgi:hypothetical protein
MPAFSLDTVRGAEYVHRRRACLMAIQGNPSRSIARQDTVRRLTHLFFSDDPHG